MWYLDCFCYGAACGREFPVNSYCHESREVLAEAAAALRADRRSGIDETRIGRETLGQHPMRYEVPK